MDRSVVSEKIDAQFDDELDALLSGESETVKDAAEDAEEYFRLIRTLSAVRSEVGRRQKDVAAEMGTTQSAISELENFRTDPQVSTLLRYARSVGCRVKLVASVQSTVAAGGPGGWQRSLRAAPSPRVSPRQRTLGDSDLATKWNNRSA